MLGRRTNVCMIWFSKARFIYLVMFHIEGNVYDVGSMPECKSNNPVSRTAQPSESLILITLMQVNFAPYLLLQIVLCKIIPLI